MAMKFGCCVHKTGNWLIERGVFEEGAMTRRFVQVAVLAALMAGATSPCRSQTSSDLNTYFQQNVGLTQDQVAAIRGGTAVAMVTKSRIPDEIFVFGAVYVKAPPESYLKLAYDFDRLRQIPGYEAIGKFSNPPQVSDLRGFALDSEDIKALKNCKPDNCQIQFPASGIEALKKSVDLSAPDAEEKVEQYLDGRVIERLLVYQKEGNQALGSVQRQEKCHTGGGAIQVHAQLHPSLAEGLAGFLQLSSRLSQSQARKCGGHVLLG
jgi:hypothetical protein